MNIKIQRISHLRSWRLFWGQTSQSECLCEFGDLAHIECIFFSYAAGIAPLFLDFPEGIRAIQTSNSDADTGNSDADVSR